MSLIKYIPVSGLRGLEAKIKLYRKLTELKQEELTIRVYGAYTDQNNISCDLHDTEIYQSCGKWVTTGNFGGKEHEIIRLGEAHISICLK